MVAVPPAETITGAVDTSSTAPSPLQCAFGLLSWPTEVAGGATDFSAASSTWL